MARAKRKSKESAELDAWIESEAVTQRGKCPLCEPKTLAELIRIEKRLRQIKKRVSMRAIWRRLTELKLINFRQDNMGKYLQRKCHLKFYKYLKGLA